MVLGIFMCLSNGVVYADAPKENGQSITKSMADLKSQMRKLWGEHIFYTRNYIISALANLEDADKISERLLKNQEDIGTAVKGYYGADASKKLTDLLKDHILIAVEVVKAAKAGNDQDLKKASDKWNANGAEIAVFLSSANPNWTKENLNQLLQKHLDLTTQEVVARLKKNWSGDVEAFDKGNEHILIMSDELSDGIIKQFPDKFKQ